MELVPYGADLDAAQRMALARISGIGQRWAFGDHRDRPRTEAVAAIHAVTRDPVVLGIALGGAIHQTEAEPRGQGLVELYRAAGADEDVAAVNLAWQRSRPWSRGRD
jgi:hypothetical protein